MRTGGEDFALALVLLGARPVWDDGSARVSGIEILPLALLDRPRVDVTLRISGLFRDAFEAQILLFDAAVRAVAARDEAADWNPLAAAARGLDGDGVAARNRARVRRGAGRLRRRGHCPGRSRRLAGAGRAWRRPIWRRPATPTARTARVSRIPAHSRRGSPRRTRSCISRTTPRPTCSTARTMRRTRAVSRPRRRRWAARRRCITPTPRVPMRRASAPWRRKSPAWCAAAPPIRPGSPA